MLQRKVIEVCIEYVVL